MHSILTRRRGRAAAAAAVTVAALIGVIPPAGAAQAAETPAELVIPAEMTPDPTAGRLPMAGSTGFVQGPTDVPGPTDGRYSWVSYADDARTPLAEYGPRPVETGSDEIAWLGDPTRLTDPHTGTTRLISIPPEQYLTASLGTSAVTAERTNILRWHLLTPGPNGVTDKTLTLPEGATGAIKPFIRGHSPYGFFLAYMLDGTRRTVWVDSSFTARTVDLDAYGKPDLSLLAGRYLFRRYPAENRLRVWDLTGDFSAPAHEMDWAGGTPVALLGDHVVARVPADDGGERLVSRPVAGGTELPLLEHVIGDTPVAPDGRVIAARADSATERSIHSLQAGDDQGPPIATKIADRPSARTALQEVTLAQGVLQTYDVTPWATPRIGQTELTAGGDLAAGPKKALGDATCGVDTCSSFVPTGDGRTVLMAPDGGVYLAEAGRNTHIADSFTGGVQASGRYLAYVSGDWTNVLDLDTRQVIRFLPHPDPSDPRIFLVGDTLWESTATAGTVVAVDVRSGATRRSLKVADCDLTDLQVNGSLLYWACGTKAGVHDTLSGQDVTVPAYDGAVLGDGYLAHQQDGVLSLTPLRGGGTTRVIGNPSKAGVNFSVDRFGGPLVYADDQDRVHVVPSGVPASDLSVLDSDTPEILDGDTAGASWSGRWWLSKPAASWTLTVKDRTGKAVRTLSGGAARGLVKAVWDGNGEGGSALADDRYTFELAATPADGSGPQLRSTGEVFLTHGRLGTYEPVAPARILDTRSGLGAPQAKVGPGHTVTLQVTGRGGIPTTGVTAVTMNVTATNPTATGYVTVFPYGEPVVPGTSSLNVTAGRTVPNLVTVPVRDGKITLYNHTGSVDLLADVAGYYTLSGAGGRFRPVAPGRVLDTRSGLGAPRAKVGAARTVTLQVAGRGGVPATGVTAVTMNVTATNPTATGYVTVYPYGTGRPSTSNLNTTAGQTVANLVTVPVKDGKVTLYNHAGTVDLLADVAGYFSTDEQGDRFAALTPARLLDTRSGIGAAQGALAPGGTVTVEVQGWGVPASGVSAVVLNVTVTSPTAAGYVSVYPYGMPRPATSNVSVAKGQTVANQVVVPVKDGKVTLYNHAGTAHLLADVAGYYTR